MITEPSPGHLNCSALALGRIMSALTCANDEIEKRNMNKVNTLILLFIIYIISMLLSLYIDNNIRENVVLKSCCIIEQDKNLGQHLHQSL